MAKKKIAAEDYGSGLRLKFHFDPNTGQFGGLLCGHAGNIIGPVTGILPQQILFDLSPIPAHRGRKPATAKDVAVLAHVVMAKQYAGGTKRDAQLKVADALCIGNAKNPENQLRQVTRHCKKAEEAFAAGDMGGDSLCSSGDSDGNGRLLLILDKQYKIESHSSRDGESFVRVDGYGWICRWGDRVAAYGRIDGGAPIDHP